MPRQLSSECNAPECKVEFAEESGEIILYVEFNGKRIARRGPNEKWVSIAPGYIVRGGEPGNYEQLEIGYNPTKARPQ